MENQFRVVRFELFESGKYQPMYSRPYQFESNQHHINRIVDETQHGVDLNPIRIAGLVSDMVKPTSYASNALDIANGWHEKRILFVLEIECKVAAFGTVRTAVLTGYADRSDVSFSGFIDPQLVLYINSVANFNNLQEPTMYGLVTRKVLINNSQFMASNLTRNYQPILNDYNNPGRAYYSPDGKLQMMRPEVIVGGIAAHELHNISSSVFDTRTHINKGAPILSKRINNTSPHYISSMLTSIRDQQDIQAQAPHPDAGFNMYNQASAAVAEPSIYSDPVLTLIAQRTSLEQTGWIKLAELENIFPDIKDPGKANFHVGTNVSAFNPNQAYVDYEGSERWDINSYEVQVASQVITGIPALMTECLMSRVSFFLSNDVAAGFVLSGEPIIQVTDANMLIDGIDPVEFIRIFISRVKNELMVALTRMNNLVVTVSGVIELAKDINLTVSVNNGTPTPFVAPTFCDTVYSPMLTNNASIVDNMILSVKHLSDELT